MKLTKNCIFLMLIMFANFSNLFSQTDSNSISVDSPLTLDSIEQTNKNSINNQINAVTVVPQEASNPVWNKLHRILGLSTVVLGGLAIGFNGENSPEELHQAFSISAASFALMTMGAGYMAHRKKVSLKKKFSYKHVHALLGMAGGYMLIAAPFVTHDKTHKALGIAGTATLGATVIVAWAF